MAIHLNAIHQKMLSNACVPGGHYWDYYPGALSLSQDIVSHLKIKYFEGLVQDCSKSIANALELLQSCTKPTISSTGTQAWNELQTAHNWVPE